MKPQRLLHLVARRGNAAEYPENTLLALQSAVDLGARFIEIDVQLAADGVPMVIHDSHLLRTAGTEGAVLEMASTTLARIDVREPARFGDRFRGVFIPRLADALTLIERRPEVTVFIGIGRASIAAFGQDQVITQILHTVRPFRSRCVVASFDLPAVHRARSGAGCQIAWKLSTFDHHNRLKYEALRPDFLICDRLLMPHGSTLWRGPWRWIVHEANTLEMALSLADRGADFVGTTHVHAMSAAMHAHAVAEPSLPVTAQVRFTRA